MVLKQKKIGLNTMWSEHKVDLTKWSIQFAMVCGMIWCEYQKFDDNIKVGAAQKWNKLYCRC